MARANKAMFFGFRVTNRAVHSFPTIVFRYVASIINIAGKTDMAEIYSDLNQAVLRHVPAGSLALDVGCATGILGAELKKRNCTVYGIECSKESASLASGKLEKIIITDLEQDLPKLDERF